MSAFFGKRKWKAVQLLQPMEGTSEFWRVIAGKSADQYPMRTLNSRYGSTRV